MIRQMVKHGFGSKVLPEYESLDPDRVLMDKRVAIVRVDGLVPPGARSRQTFDVQVSALEGNSTTSLAHGKLYFTDLFRNGADPRAVGLEFARSAFHYACTLCNWDPALLASAEGTPPPVS